MGTRGAREGLFSQGLAGKAYIIPADITAQLKGPVKWDIFSNRNIRSSQGQPRLCV